MYTIRFIYTKQSGLSYISHLDSLRLFERTLKRANIDTKHSEGFNPRPCITFAHPLSLGIESVAEICEIELNSKVDIDLYISSMNNCLPDGIRILSAEYIDKCKKSLMAKVYASDYEITLESKYMDKLVELLSYHSIVCNKKSKNKESEVDIRPMILEYKVIDESNIRLKLSTGSAMNLNPDLVMKCLEKNIGENIEYNIKRTKIYIED